MHTTASGTNKIDGEQEAKQAAGVAAPTLAAASIVNDVLNSDRLMREQPIGAQESGQPVAAAAAKTACQTRKCEEKDRHRVRSRRVSGGRSGRG